MMSKPERPLLLSLKHRFPDAASSPHGDYFVTKLTDALLSLQQNVSNGKREARDKKVEKKKRSIDDLSPIPGIYKVVLA